MSYESHDALPDTAGEIPEVLPSNIRPAPYGSSSVADLGGSYFRGLGRAHVRF
jgi:hypothetical protein